MNSRIEREGGSPVELVVFGGAALVFTGLYKRTTNDVDVLAMKNAGFGLVDPDPLSDYLIRAAEIVARILGLPVDWLNMGPADLLRLKPT